MSENEELERIRAQLETKQEELVFERLGDAKLLAEGLSRSESSHVKSMKLIACVLIVDGTKYVREFLWKNSFLRKLCLDGAVMVGDEGGDAQEQHAAEGF